MIMSYKCYVFEHASDLINSVNEYQQHGGNLNDVKVLIKDVEYGQVLSSAGLHHIDYLNQIISASHSEEDSDQDIGERPPFFFGLTTGQNVPGVISGFFDFDKTNAMEALGAYGLSEERARQALDELRVGRLLLFVPLEHSTGNRYDTLHDTLDASFGKDSSYLKDVSINGATYTLQDDE